MSYDVHFDCDDLEIPHNLKGGTYALGGTTQPCLNITYNYSRHFYNTLGEDGIRSLYGKTASEIIPILDKAIERLGTERAADYWAATPEARDVVNFLKALLPEGETA